MSKYTYISKADQEYSKHNIAYTMVIFLQQKMCVLMMI